MVRTKQNQGGFTLIELLVVVVIIGILASVAVPNFMGAQDKAKNSSVQANAHNVQMGLEQFGVDNSSVYPTTVEGIAKILTNNYLNGDKYPKTPWNETQPNATIIAAVPADIALGQGTATEYGAGVVKFGADLKTYGGIAYANAGSAQERYDLTASGKRGDKSICVVHVKNY